MNVKIELTANDCVDNGGMKMWVVATNIDCINNYRAAFGNDGINHLENLMNSLKQDFYEIKRYFQFVGIFEYHHSLNMYTMKLFEPTSTDSHLESFTKLTGTDWRTPDLEKISRISEEIINDKNLIEAILTVYDPIEKFKEESGI